MTSATMADIEQQARMLAADHREVEPSVSSILWFKSADEIRIIEVQDTAIPSDSGRVDPFYFLPSPKDGLTACSAVAIIRPAEVGKLSLPDGWGRWDEAVSI